MAPALPGPVLVFAGLLMAAWIDGFENVGWAPLTVLVVLTAPAAGARRRETAIAPAGGARNRG